MFVICMGFFEFNLHPKFEITFFLFR